MYLALVPVGQRKINAQSVSRGLIDRLKMSRKALLNSRLAPPRVPERHGVVLRVPLCEGAVQTGGPRLGAALREVKNAIF